MTLSRSLRYPNSIIFKITYNDKKTRVELMNDARTKLSRVPGPESPNPSPRSKHTRYRFCTCYKTLHPLYKTLPPLQDFAPFNV